MNEVFTVEKEFLFKNKIYEITSMSIEYNFDIIGSNCKGEFILSGDYRLHEVSINKEDFSFKFPFNVEINSNINLDSVEVEITDFSYGFNEDVLTAYVEYIVRGEQSLIEFAEETDLEEFLQNNETEIINLSEEEDNKEPEELIEEKLFRETENFAELSPEITPVEIPENNEFLDTNPKINAEGVGRDKDQEIVPEENKISEVDKDAIIDNINTDESFVTYNVHTVTASDTVDEICKAYKISGNDLKRFNDIDELTLNQKLIIPDEEN